MEQPNASNSVAVKIIYFIMLGSVLFYAFALLMTEKTSMSLVPEKSTLFMMFLSTAIVVIFAGFFFNSKANSSQTAQQYFTLKVVAWILCDFIAVKGFVLAFITGSFLYYLIFTSIAVLFFGIFRPNQKLMEKLESSAPQ